MPETRRTFPTALSAAAVAAPMAAPGTASPVRIGVVGGGFGAEF